MILALEDDVGSFWPVDQSPVELTGVFAGDGLFYIFITFFVLLHDVYFVFDCPVHEVLGLELEVPDETLLWLVDGDGLLDFVGVTAVVGVVDPAGGLPVRSQPEGAVVVFGPLGRLALELLALRAELCSHAQAFVLLATEADAFVTATESPHEHLLPPVHVENGESVLTPGFLVDLVLCELVVHHRLVEVFHGG